MHFPSLFTFCPHCAEELRAFDSDGISRRQCPACGWIQYRNPTVGVAAVLVEESRLLIGRRRSGGWCIPCGHVEYDESVEQAAVREMAEETGLDVSLQGILAVKSNFHDPRHQTVGIWFWGQRRGGSLRPGGDLAEAAFVDFTRLPPLRFPTDCEVVEAVRAADKTQD
jgi:ADP-ribose pyrophosphatase YjhB (NUDIX family)